MTFRVGDKGKTCGGDDYEAVAELYNDVRDQTFLWVIVSQQFRTYTDDGFISGSHPDKASMHLLPPKQKIEGFLRIYKTGRHQFSHMPLIGTEHAGIIAIIPITIEFSEGDGLD